jgi:hypothetical protein
VPTSATAQPLFTVVFGPQYTSSIPFSPSVRLPPPTRRDSTLYPITKLAADPCSLTLVYYLRDIGGSSQGHGKFWCRFYPLHPPSRPRPRPIHSSCTPEQDIFATHLYQAAGKRSLPFSTHHPRAKTRQYGQTPQLDFHLRVRPQRTDGDSIYHHV